MYLLVREIAPMTNIICYTRAAQNLYIARMFLAFFDVHRFDDRMFSFIQAT